MVGSKLEAFFLNRKAAEMLPDNLRHLHRFPLNDQLALVPVTIQLCKEVEETFGKYEAGGDPYEDSLFMRLHPALIRMAVKISHVAPVLYLERDVWSGIGDSSAIVWHKGEAIFGPEWGGSFTTEAFRIFAKLEGMTLEQIGKLDYFRHRFTEDWVKHLENETGT